MTKYLLLILFSTLFSCTNNDSEKPKEEIPTPTTPVSNDPKTLLWKIEIDTTLPASYLFGTLHEVGNSIFDSFGEAKHQLQESKFCLLETLIHQSNDDLKELFKFEKQKVTTIDNIWKSILTGEEYDIFKSSLIKTKKANLICVPAQDIYAQLSYYTYENFCQPSYAKSDSLTMENYIEKIAKSSKKNLIGLDDEINFKHVSPVYDKNYDYLKNQSKEDIKDMISIMNQILNDTVNCSDTKKYLAFDIQYSFDKFVDYETYGLNLRNEKWMPIIEKTIKKGKTFIAVGYQHLCYSNGLIQRLKSKGYKVTPVVAR